MKIRSGSNEQGDPENPETNQEGPIKLRLEAMTI